MALVGGFQRVEIRQPEVRMPSRVAWSALCPAVSCDTSRVKLQLYLRGSRWLLSRSEKAHAGTADARRMRTLRFIPYFQAWDSGDCPEQEQNLHRR